MTFLPDLERSFLEAAERHELREQGGAGAPALLDAPAHEPARAASTRPRRRWRLPVLGGGALVAACAAVVIAVVGLPGSQDRLSLVEEASAALAPDDGILYLKLSSKSRASMNGKPIASVGQAALTQHTEQWSTTEPRRYRYVVHASEERSRWNPDQHVQPHVEFSWANRASTDYDADRGSMRTITGYNVNSSASRPPALFGDAPISMEDLRAALANGKLKEQGRAVVNGHDLIRLVGTLPATGAAREAHLAYEVDATTFEPRRIIVRWTITFPGPHITSMENTSVVTVEDYARLPLTPENEQLLTIHPPAGTRIKVQTLDEVRAGRAASERRNDAARRKRAAAREAAKRAQATPKP